MVLHNWKGDAVTLLDILLAPCVSHHIDGFSGITSEYHRWRVVGSDKLCHRTAGLLVSSRRKLRKRVEATVNVGISGACEIGYSLDYTLGLLGGGAAVQKSQRVTVHRLF